MSPRPAAPPSSRSRAASPADSPRRRLSRALSHCAAEERVLLALLLFERLTPSEAAAALSLSVADVESRLDHLLGELAGALRGLPFRVRRSAAAGVRLRKAS